MTNNICFECASPAEFKGLANIFEQTCMETISKGILAQFHGSSCLVMVSVFGKQVSIDSYIFLFPPLNYTPPYSLSPVTVCRRKAQFPDRDHLISHSSLHKALLFGLGKALLLRRIYYTVAQWFWFSASTTMQCLLVNLVRGINGQCNELWHQSINIVFPFSNQIAWWNIFLRNPRRVKVSIPSPSAVWIFVLIIEERLWEWKEKGSLFPVFLKIYGSKASGLFQTLQTENVSTNVWRGWNRICVSLSHAVSHC